MNSSFFSPYVQINCIKFLPPLPHQPLLHRPKHQPGMGLYPGFFQDGGAVAHEAAHADIEFGGNVGTIGVLAHQAGQLLHDCWD